MQTRIDQIWNGSPSPLVVDGKTYGLAVSDYAAPFHLVLAKLEEAIQEDIPTATLSPVGGAVRFTAPIAVDVACAQGFAVWLGWGSSTYTGVTVITGTGVPPAIQTGHTAGLGLPVYIWVRSVVGGQSVVWTAPHMAFDVTITKTQSNRENWAIDRIPHVLYFYDDTPWSLDNPDGYLPLRPLSEQRQETLMDNAYAGAVTYEYRGVVIEGSLDA